MNLPSGPASLAGSINAATQREGSTKSRRSEDAISISPTGNRVKYSPQVTPKLHEERAEEGTGAASEAEVSGGRGKGEEEEEAGEEKEEGSGDEGEEEEDPVYDDILSPSSKTTAPDHMTTSSRLSSTPRPAPIRSETAEDRDEAKMMSTPPTKADPDLAGSRPSTASSEGFATPSPTLPTEAISALMLATPPTVGGAPLSLSSDGKQSQDATDYAFSANGPADELEPGSKQSTLKSEENGELSPTAVTIAPGRVDGSAQSVGQGVQLAGGWRFQKRSIYDSDDSDEDFIDSSVLDQILEESRKQRAESLDIARGNRLDVGEQTRPNEGTCDSQVGSEVDGLKVEVQRLEDTSAGGSSPLSNGTTDGYQDALMEQPEGTPPSRTDDVIQPATVDTPPPAADKDASISENGEGKAKVEVEISESGEADGITEEIAANDELSTTDEHLNDSPCEGEKEGEGEGEREGEVEMEGERVGVGVGEENNLKEDSHTSLVSVEVLMTDNSQFSRFDVSQSLVDGTFTPVEQTLTDSAVRDAQALLGGLDLRERLAGVEGEESDEYSSLPEDEDGESSWANISISTPGSTASGDRRSSGAALKGRTSTWLVRTLERDAQVGVSE